MSRKYYGQFFLLSLCALFLGNLLPQADTASPGFSDLGQLVSGSSSFRFTNDVLIVDSVGEVYSRPASDTEVSHWTSAGRMGCSRAQRFELVSVGEIPDTLFLLPFNDSVHVHQKEIG